MGGVLHLFILRLQQRTDSLVYYFLIQAIAEESKTIYGIGAYLKESARRRHCRDVSLRSKSGHMALP